MSRAFVFLPLPQPAIPVANSEMWFPVRRIYCVGRNYLAHIQELGNDEKQPPIFFSKPADALLPDGSTLPYASATENLHYEVELAVALQSGGYNIAEAAALSHVYGYATALDMTRRDLQKQLSSKGNPWDVAKGFDNSCPIGALHPASEVGHPSSGNIRLAVNGVMKQDSDLSLMIWNVPQIIAELSRFHELKAGDLILTGTPAGVGPVVPGDVMEASIAGLSPLTITVGPSAA